MAGKRQSKSFKCLMWMVAGGSEGKHLKTKEVKKMQQERRKGSGGSKEKHENEITQGAVGLGPGSELCNEVHS